MPNPETSIVPTFPRVPDVRANLDNDGGLSGGTYLPVYLGTPHGWSIGIEMSATGLRIPTARDVVFEILVNRTEVSTPATGYGVTKRFNPSPVQLSFASPIAVIPLAPFGVPHGLANINRYASGTDMTIWGTAIDPSPGIHGFVWKTASNVQWAVASTISMTSTAFRWRNTAEQFRIPSLTMNADGLSGRVSPFPTESPLELPVPALDVTAETWRIQTLSDLEIAPLELSTAALTYRVAVDQELPISPELTNTAETVRVGWTEDTLAIPVTISSTGITRRLGDGTGMAISALESYSFGVETAHIGRFETAPLEMTSSGSVVLTGETDLELAAGLVQMWNFGASAVVPNDEEDLSNIGVGALYIRASSTSPYATAMYSEGTVNLPPNPPAVSVGPNNLSTSPIGMSSSGNSFGTTRVSSSMFAIAIETDTNGLAIAVNIGTGALEVPRPDWTVTAEKSLCGSGALAISRPELPALTVGVAGGPVTGTGPFEITNGLEMTSSAVLDSPPLGDNVELVFSIEMSSENNTTSIPPVGEAEDLEIGGIEFRQTFGISRTFDFSTYAREPISVDQLHGAFNYPFFDPQPDTAVGDIVADLFILLPPEAYCEYDMPLRIGWLSGFGTAPIARPSGVPAMTHGYDIGILDNQDNVVFDSTAESTEFVSTPWGSRLRVTEWRQEDRVLRVVHNVAWETEDQIVDYPVFIVPTGPTELDLRTIKIRPRRVRRVRAGAGGLWLPDSGALVLRAGYNVALEVLGTEVQPSGRQVTRIGVAGLPGEGLGRFNRCDESGQTEDRPVYSVATARPTETGDLFINGDDCYRVSQNQTGLILDMSCRPCCSCDDYVAVGNAIGNVKDDIRSLAEQAEMVRDVFKDVIDTWNDRSQCSDDGQRLLAKMAASKGGASVAAAYCYGGTVCKDLVIRFNMTLITKPKPEVLPVASSEIQVGDPGITGGDGTGVQISGWPSLAVRVPNVEPNTVIGASFQISYPSWKIASGTLSAVVSVESDSVSLSRSF